MLLRARVVLPVSGPPIENGAVWIEGHRIRAVGRWESFTSDERRAVTDLGECILLPGLINAHCHLDYTNLAGLIPPPRSFTDWIKALVALKASWSVAEFAQSWRHGAEMLLATGTTTVADVEAVPELLPEAWSSTPLRVISFRELIGLKADRAASSLVQHAVSECAALSGASGRIGLSPHATYSTTTELLELSARAARRFGWRLTTHVAESAEEFEMFLYRHGPMFDWLKGQRDMSDCGRGSPIQHLDRCGYLEENLIAVHVNYLWRGDATTLGHSGASVVHCPRSHDYFRPAPFPRQELADARVNLCLGTDSLVSVRKERGEALQLNLFAEMRTHAEQFHHVAPATILRMATLHSAAALGKAGHLGELSPGGLADLITIPFGGPPVRAEEAAVHHSGEVRDSLIDGRWAIRDHARL